MPQEAYWAVLYAGIASSCFAHGINSWAISHVSGRGTLRGSYSFPLSAELKPPMWVALTALKLTSLYW